MKRMPFLTLVFLLFGLTNVAFADDFFIFSDPSYSSTEAFDTAPGTLTLYVFHYPPPPDHVGFPTVGSELYIVPDGFTGVWLSDEALYSGGSGSSQTGWTTWYTFDNVGGPLVAVTYMTFGTSPPDSRLKLSSSWGPYPVIWIATQFSPQPAAGYDLLINPSNPTAVTPSTWGAVKALYR